MYYEYKKTVKSLIGALICVNLVGFTIYIVMFSHNYYEAKNQEWYMAFIVGHILMNFALLCRHFGASYVIHDNGITSWPYEINFNQMKSVQVGFKGTLFITTDIPRIDYLCIGHSGMPVMFDTNQSLIIFLRNVPNVDIIKNKDNFCGYENAKELFQSIIESNTSPP